MEFPFHIPSNFHGSFWAKIGTQNIAFQLKNRLNSGRNSISKLQSDEIELRFSIEKLNIERIFEGKKTIESRSVSIAFNLSTLLQNLAPPGCFCSPSVESATGAIQIIFRSRQSLIFFTV